MFILTIAVIVSIVVIRVKCILISFFMIFGMNL